MIVTADPLGDFNATSQILRYSALAREVTVPRIPSVASTILSATAAAAAAAKGGGGGEQQQQQLLLSSGRTTPTMVAASTEELAFAAREMTRLSEEVESMNIRLTEEQNRRQEAELALQALQERYDVMDQEIREECWAEAERQMEEERAKWKGAWYEEVSFKRGFFFQT
jgi:chromosome segregation ATPase